MGSARWVSLVPGSASPALRLFVLPHAGGGASAYRPLRQVVPADVELALVHLPGREGRLHDPVPPSLGELADQVTEGLTPHASVPFALFGHSMGALLGFEVALRLVARGLVARHLFVSGHRAPHLLYPRPPAAHLPDARLDEVLRSLGGTPEEVLAHPELMALLRPTFRADLANCERHPPVATRPLPFPLTAYAGTQDAHAPPEEVEAWQSHAGAGFAFHRIPGGHFFLRQPAFAARFAADLRRLVDQTKL